MTGRGHMRFIDIRNDVHSECTRRGLAETGGLCCSTPSRWWRGPLLPSLQQSHEVHWQKEWCSECTRRGLAEMGGLCCSTPSRWWRGPLRQFMPPSTWGSSLRPSSRRGNSLCCVRHVGSDLMLSESQGHKDCYVCWEQKMTQMRIKGTGTSPATTLQLKRHFMKLCVFVFFAFFLQKTVKCSCLPFFAYFLYFIMFVSWGGVSLYLFFQAPDPWERRVRVACCHRMFTSSRNTTRIRNQRSAGCVSSPRQQFSTTGKMRNWNKEENFSPDHWLANA